MTCFFVWLMTGWYSFVLINFQVSLSPWFWLLVIRRWYKHPAILWSSIRESSCRSCGSYPVSEGKSSDWCIPSHQPQYDGAWPGTKANHIKFGPSPKTISSSPHPWPQSSLLLHQHKLQEEWIGTENAAEPPQKVLDGWTHFIRLQRTLFHQWDNSYRHVGLS